MAEEVVFVIPSAPAATPLSRDRGARRAASGSWRGVTRSGATQRYTHPVAYLLVTFATFAVTGALAGGEASLMDGSNRVLTATAVPVVAVAARGVFWRVQLN